MRGITAGFVGFCTATGDLVQVVEAYTKMPGHKNNSLAKYLRRLHVLADKNSPSTTGLEGLKEAWEKEALNEDFKNAQRQIAEKLYFGPAEIYGKKLGLRSPLAKVVLREAIIQHGDVVEKDRLGKLKKCEEIQSGQFKKSKKKKTKSDDEGDEGDDDEFEELANACDSIQGLIYQATQRVGGIPKNGIVSEGKWLEAFLVARLNQLRKPANPKTEEEWKESAGRAETMLELFR